MEFGSAAEQVPDRRGRGRHDVDKSWNDIVRVMGGGSRRPAIGRVPALVMMAEHSTTVMRALERKESVKLRVNVDARFLNDDNQPGYNTIAEIPGSGPDRNEVVMLGAHMDSWHTGSGANDNGAGVAVMMEAGAHPEGGRRAAQPHHPSRAVDRRGAGPDRLAGIRGQALRRPSGRPIRAEGLAGRVPQQQRARAGEDQRTTGRSPPTSTSTTAAADRGIYAQENLAIAPIFEEWMKPWNDVGATIITSATPA
ncbi:MAG: M28 family peptidase, partial [Thermomonas sp.]|nr:M28 family peptidase [Thermomonas sp.]